MHSQSLIDLKDRRLDPDYHLYYYSQKNINPRLPPPIFDHRVWNSKSGQDTQDELKFGPTLEHPTPSLLAPTKPLASPIGSPSPKSHFENDQIWRRSTQDELLASVVAAGGDTRTVTPQPDYSSLLPFQSRQPTPEAPFQYRRQGSSESYSSSGSYSAQDSRTDIVNSMASLRINEREVS